MTFFFLKISFHFSNKTFFCFNLIFCDNKKRRKVMKRFVKTKNKFPNKISSYFLFYCFLESFWNSSRKRRQHSDNMHKKFLKYFSNFSGICEILNLKLFGIWRAEFLLICIAISHSNSHKKERDKIFKIFVSII